MVEPVHNPSEADLASFHRTLAPRAFNHTWTLLDAKTLSRDEEEEMLASTLAQRYHWYIVGTPRQKAIADWQVSRVAVVLGYADLARRFGQRSLDVAETHELDAFVVGFAHEAIARSAAAVDDVETFTQHLEKAKACLAEIDEPEDRDVLQSDLAEMSEL